MNKTTKTICYSALGAALYVVVSMLIKIPVVGHISLDLGYIVFAVFCYTFGPVVGIATGAIGCLLVSLLASGWIPHGWILGQVLIGLIAGVLGNKRRNSSYTWKTRVIDCVIICLVVLLGIGGIKTAVECPLYSIPLAVKLPKNMIAAVMDAVVMAMGWAIAPSIMRRTKKTGLEV